MANKNIQENIYVIIPAAGSGQRLGAELPKQYLSLGGKPVLSRTLDKFAGYEVVVAISPDHQALYEVAATGQDKVQCVTGGNTRKISVFNALNYFLKVNDDDLIVIHDAARPFVRTSEINAVIEKARETGAATLASPLAATLYDAVNDTTVDRDGKWAIQTPQVFRAGLIRKAHETYKDDDGFTDDAGMVRALGHDVALVKSGRHNFKITTAEDFEMAETLLRAETQTISTMGYDIHAFEVTETMLSPRKRGSDEGGEKTPAFAGEAKRFVTLGGIKIPHHKSLSGHSDADVVLHALTDAILGAIGQGDIGTHFPPSDPQWKGAESALFVTHALKLLKEAGGELVHIDINLQCQAPKIFPHREEMISNLAALTGLPPARIGLKATTLEGLGALGREEGIAAYVNATIRL